MLWRTMKATPIPLALSLACMLSAWAESPPQLRIEGTLADGWSVQFPDRPAGTTWALENSMDLTGWDPVQPGGVPVLFESGKDSVALDSSGETRYFRAVRVDDPVNSALYEVGVLRDFHIEFDQSDWRDQLRANFGTGTNILGDLIVDGVRYSDVGVRYKGQTSYEFANALKKPFAIDVDHTDPDLRVMGFKSLNLHNGYRDPSFMREVLYSNASREYLPSPRVSFIRLFVNGAYYGIYNNSQQENRDLLEEWFDDPDGDRWRAGTGEIRAVGGRIDFGGSLRWEGANPEDYGGGYELKNDSSDEMVAWTSLIVGLDVLNNTPEEDLPDLIDGVFAVDRWLWLFIVENVFADEDGYLFKAGDYLLFRDADTGRFHPIQHDGNECFAGSRVTRSPFDGENLPLARPLTTKLYAMPRVRQRFLAHLRTFLERTFTIENLGAKIDGYAAMIREHVAADTINNSSLAQFDVDTSGGSASLKEFVRDRRAFLLAHAEVDVPSPQFQSVELSGDPVSSMPTKIEATFDTAAVAIRGAILFYAVGDPNRQYIGVPMTDEGAGAFSAEIPVTPSGTTVYYYVEGEAEDQAGTLAYHPVLAEARPSSFEVKTEVADDTPVIINELMASNSSTLADPQGEFDDWIELRNVSGADLDIGGMFLSDNPANVRKWRIPDGTMIPANDFLLVWADEDGGASPALHANFKLSADGETLLLSDRDSEGNALLDSIDFGLQATDVSLGRSAADPDEFTTMDPTPGMANID